VAIHTVVGSARVFSWVDQDADLGETGFDAVVEILFDTTKLVEVVSSFGTLRIWILEKSFSIHSHSICI
jgi:hypothetical protein